MAPTLRYANLMTEKAEMKPEIPTVHVKPVQQGQAALSKTERAKSKQPERPNVHVEAVQQQQAPPLKTKRAESQQPERPNVHVEAVQQEQTPPPQKKKKGKPAKKRQRFYTAVRRSPRFQNTGTPSRNKSVQPAQVTLSESESESEREEEPPQLEENVEAQAGEKTLAEKVDYAVTLLEAMSSQIQTLKKENIELSLKVQAALAKIEGFEKGKKATNASVDLMEKFNDVLLITSLSKASEMAAAIQRHDPKAASSSKRKR